MQENDIIQETNKGVIISEPGNKLGISKLKVAPIIITGANPKIRSYPISRPGWIDVPIFI